MFHVETRGVPSLDSWQAVEAAGGLRLVETDHRAPSGKAGGRCRVLKVLSGPRGCPQARELGSAREAYGRTEQVRGEAQTAFGSHTEEKRMQSERTAANLSWGPEWTPGLLPDCVRRRRAP